MSEIPQIKRAGDRGATFDDCHVEIIEQMFEIELAPNCDIQVFVVGGKLEVAVVRGGVGTVQHSRVVEPGHTLTVEKAGDYEAVWYGGRLQCVIDYSGGVLNVQWEG